MKPETKDELKKKASTAASTAAGATAGVIMGTLLTPEEAAAQEPARPNHNTVAQQRPTVTEEKPDTTGDNTVNGPVNQSDVEVIAYDRVDNGDGTQSDIAVISVNGAEVGVIDADLDGKADLIACDLNGDQVIDENEIQVVTDQNIPMQPFQDATGFNPLYAQTDMPDYVNDADVDTYMA